MDFSIDESPAVKALGPLFKLTEVHLWDDGSSEVRESAYFQEPVKLIDGFCSISEDVELAKKLNDMGLPLSFHTNKETRHGMFNGKRKGTRKNNQQSHIEIDYMADSIKESMEESRFPASLIDTSKMLGQPEILKNGIVSDIVADIDGLSNLSLERGDSLNSTACTSTLSNEHDYNGLEFDHCLGGSSGLSNNILDEVESTPCTNEMIGGHSEGSCLINEGADSDGKEINGLNSVNREAIFAMDHEIDGQSNDISPEVIQDLDFATCAQFSEQTSSNMVNNHQLATSGEWIAYWDEFYKRTYFYNVETGESTWDPPSGMEHLVCGNMADEPTNIEEELDNEQMDLRKPDEVEASCDLQSHVYSAQDSRNDNGSLSQELDGISGNGLFSDNVSSNTTKRKKRVRRIKSNRKLFVSSEDLQGVLQEVPPSINKYWCQRYLLFSRFDYGIKMDEEGWFSVTPEPLAKHHAVRCGNGAIVDFFTGVGGNAIQFAQWSKHVIAIDIDPNKIDYARHNAAIYGVDDNIDFIKGDSFSLAPKLKANTVFMSPPWGGPDYSKVKKFDINTMLKPRDGQFLFNAGKGIAPKIVMFLPRNVDINQLAELSLSATPPWSLEVEMNFLNGRLKAVTAYFFEPSMS
ncbi:hypothetical protein DH2020_004078 [Rehmannia glutinosa]|uniref:Trimethylguanosine synthase n=1 Tax=Rehmannia glutinosa TaxID=99300 RepID=A0ABR0XNG5_REHGL